MSNRTDIHSPTNLITEDYDFFGCGNFGTSDLPAFSPLNTPYGQKLLDQGWRFGENSSAGQCYHCGQGHLVYYALLLHRPTRTIIRVGEQCLDNRFDLASIEFHNLRKSRRLNRERKARTEKVQQFLSVPKNRAAFEFCEESVEEGNHGWNGMRFDFVHTVNRKGETSEKFVDAIIRDIMRTEKWEARKAEEALSAKPAPEGKVVVEGIVQSLKVQDSDFGSTLKMVVSCDGWKVWVTVPVSIENVQKGDKVRFTATLTPSEKDPSFAFGKRPSKAIITEEAL